MTTTEAPATLFIGGRVMTMTPRLRADLVVLEGELDPKNPPRVAETWVAGQQVYQSVRYRGRHD